MKKILIVVGTRPNFIKVTQFKRVAENFPDIEVKVVHTGQHYDSKMADVFFEQFQLIPDFFLNIKPATANSQMAEIMTSLEKLMTDTYTPDLLLVVGDVNSTFAAALTANKMGIKLAHVESGLRSEDRTMPEEINRLLTDEITDFFFVTEQSGLDNLAKEGKPSEKVHLVGNTMIDTLVAFDDKVQQSEIMEMLNLTSKGFALMTMHRPATVDNEAGLKKLIVLINSITAKQRLVFPIHPRTINRLEQFGLYKELTNNDALILTDPLDYFAFQKLIFESSMVITDSGGIQEETTFRQVPCLTLRPNTERPSTIEIGSNTLAEFDIESLDKLITAITDGTYKKGQVPPLWDGKATDRILAILNEKLN